MKKLILFVSMVAFAGFASAQKTDDKKPADTKAKTPAVAAAAPSIDPPAAIKAKFASSYTSAKDVKWTEDKENYVATFEQNKVKVSVVYDGAGNLVETRTETKVGDLPPKISEYVKKNMGKKTKVTKATKVTDAKGVVTFDCVVNEKTETFDAKGKYLGQNDGN